MNDRLEQEAIILKMEAAELRLQKQTLELEKESSKVLAQQVPSEHAIH